ncbi:MAG TPA: hypothetical protein VGJ92_02925 [Methanocella sp.]
MKESPLVIRHLESLDVVLLGSVHTLGRNVPLILGAIDRFSPGFVAIELTDPAHMTGSLDVDAANGNYHDRIICIDRSPDITASRYLCNTPPTQYIRECMHRYAALPLNQASILAYNYLPGIYHTLGGDNFYTFGWSVEDARRYIFERDEYMAARLIDHMRSQRDKGYLGRYAVVVGRRHVAGMAAILEAYAVTGSAGSYYAGGRVYDLFSIDRLDRPYDIGKDEAAHNIFWNRFVESLARTVCLPAIMLVLFLAAAFVVALIAVAIITTFSG